jgi:DNA-binding response OmpR family regulator
MDEARLARLSVLIVDDSVHMRGLLKRLLGLHGIRYTADAIDGHTAMKQLQAHNFDLVLVDLEMQPMNGIEFTRQLRHGAISNRVPVIMISGHTERHHVKDARDAGVNEFLVKPVTPKNLFGRISEVFDRPRPFVSSPGYIGPERRRKDWGEGVPKRREDDKVKRIIELD